MNIQEKQTTFSHITFYVALHSAHTHTLIVTTSYLLLTCEEVNRWRKRNPSIYIFSSVLLKRIGGPLRSRRIHIWWCSHNILMECRSMLLTMFTTLSLLLWMGTNSFDAPGFSPIWWSNERWSFMLRVQLIVLKAKWTVITALTTILCKFTNLRTPAMNSKLIFYYIHHYSWNFPHLYNCHDTWKDQYFWARFFTEI